MYIDENTRRGTVDAYHGRVEVLTAKMKEMRALIKRKRELLGIKDPARSMTPEERLNFLRRKQRLLEGRP